MLIRILKNLAGPTASYWPDNIVDVRDAAVVQAWISDGAAEPFDIDAVIASGAEAPHVHVYQPVA